MKALTTDKTFIQMKEQLIKLYSPDIENNLQKNLDEINQQNFIRQRACYRNFFYELQSHELELSLKKLKTFSIEINRVMTNLNTILQDVNNAINIIRSLEEICSLLKKI